VGCRVVAYLKETFREDRRKQPDVFVTDDGQLLGPAPLPARAQFLNVIESIFSGMARAIIHNSDYGSVDKAKEAIDRYFEERNRHFLDHPRRREQIWGKERVLRHSLRPTIARIPDTGDGFLC